MTMNIGAVSLGWSGVPLPEVFAQLKAMGGEVIEINGNAERHHGIALTPDALSQIRRWADAAGLQIGSLSGYCDFAQVTLGALDGEIERLLTTCRAAAQLGVPVVRAFVGDTKSGLTWEQIRPSVVIAFQRACQEAAALGVTLGIENHGHLVNDGPALAALVDEVGADNLGFTLDTGNFAWAGHDEDQVQADFVAVLPRVVNVHIKDGIWTPDGFEFVPAGEGDLPLIWLLDQLKAIGYTGPIYSEYEGAGSFAEGTQRSIAFLKQHR